LRQLVQNHLRRDGVTGRGDVHADGHYRDERK
jgi:hypothetical protein